MHVGHVEWQVSESWRLNGPYKLIQRSVPALEAPEIPTGPKRTLLRRRSTLTKQTQVNQKIAPLLSRLGVCVCLKPVVRPETANNDAGDLGYSLNWQRVSGHAVRRRWLSPCPCAVPAVSEHSKAQEQAVHYDPLPRSRNISTVIRACGRPPAVPARASSTFESVTCRVRSTFTLEHTKPASTMHLDSSSASMFAGSLGLEYRGVYTPVAYVCEHCDSVSLFRRRPCARTFTKAMAATTLADSRHDDAAETPLPAPAFTGTGVAARATARHALAPPLGAAPWLLSTPGCRAAFSPSRECPPCSLSPLDRISAIARFPPVPPPFSLPPTSHAGSGSQRHSRRRPATIALTGGRGPSGY